MTNSLLDSGQLRIHGTVDLTVESVPLQPFTPTDLSGLTWWGDHTSLPIVGAGNPLPTWPGLAGLPTLTAIPGEQPLLDASGGPVGQPCAVFDGVDDAFLFGALSSFVELSGNATFFMVVKHANRPTGGYLFLDVDGGNYYVDAYPDNGQKLFGRSANASIDAFSGLPDGTWSVVVARVWNDVVSLWVNGIKGTDSVAGAHDFAASHRLYMGAGSEGGWQGYGLCGRVIEAGVYRVPHSDENIETKLSPYLTEKQLVTP